MPITSDGEFEQLTAEEIAERLETAFENQFDSSVQPGDFVLEQFEALAETLASNQEAAMEAVYQSAYLQDAEGVALDKLTDRLGIDRREAVAATGIIELFSDDVQSASYTVPSGTVFQTDGSDNIRFETNTVARLGLLDDFEDDNLDNWRGDTGEWDTVEHDSASDTYVLEKPATDESELIYDRNGELPKGTTFNFDVYFETDTTLGVRFGRQSEDDYFEAVIDEYESELRIEYVKDGDEEDSESASYDVPTEETIHVEVEHGPAGDTRLSVYDSADRDEERETVTLDEYDEYHDGEFAFISRDDTDNVYIDTVATTHTAATIEAVDGGVDTNLSPNTITVATESLSGVDGQTNPLPTGDDEYVTTEGDTFTQGRDRETDEELRERAFESTIIGGAATTNALESALRDIDHVDSLTLYRNKDDEESDGLPPHSFEAAVYYSGPDEDIAQAIFETKAIDSTDVGGVNGDEVTYDVDSDVLPTSETIHWSAVPETDLDIELTLVVDDEYVGADDIRSLIVNYIGGMDVGGESVNGLSVGEDLYVAVLEDVIVGPQDTGVWAVDDITIDSNGDGDDDTEELSNGAEAYKVDNNEVVVTNARDGSIEISTVDK